MSKTHPGSPSVPLGEGLDKLLNPKSVAVIGASTKPATVGYAAFNNYSVLGPPGLRLPLEPDGAQRPRRPGPGWILDIKDEADFAVLVVPLGAEPTRSIAGRRRRQGSGEADQVTAH